MSLDLDSFVAVPIPTALYASLVARFPDRVSTVVENVVTDFLERNDPDFLVMPESTGVQWESLFLPDGTQIRTKYFGEYKTASIKKEAILWDGNTYSSIAQLANTMRGNTSNNAWKVLEIKRPSDKLWMPAQALRR